MNKAINVNLSKKFNFACYQNDIAILKELKLTNNTNNCWNNIKLTMKSSQQLIEEKIWLLDEITSGEERIINDRKIDLNGDYLKTLTESEKVQIKFILEVNTEIVAQDDFEIEVLAKNEWGGTEYIPELLATFVTPNAQGIDEIISQVGSTLKDNNKNYIINGYKDERPSKIWEIASALYTVLSNKNFTYCLPPASFEKNGQKIRLPQDILNNKVITCLDSTILFASVFEQMGLNPVIIVLKDHAFVGIWLKNESFAQIIVTDPEQIRKRIVLNELLVLETTAITNSPPPKFSIAKSIAEDKISYGNDEEFELLVDIHTARTHLLKPISFNDNKDVSQIKSDNDANSALYKMEEAPKDLDSQKHFESEKNTNCSRLDIWQKKLLNLSPSNPLLNCKITQTNLAILCPQPEKLEDYLADGVKMSLVSAESILQTKIDSELRALRTGENILKEQALQALKNKLLLVNTPESKISSQLTALYRKTKTILEEGGANTLYLAIGFLNWKKKDKTEKVYHAPLVLCPVKLDRISVKSGVKLSAHEDESRFNTTLLQMLEQDFEISIPQLQGELPTEEKGLDILQIWNIVRQAVKEIEGFEVVEEVVLGHFSFNKYLMWKDLADRADELKKHPLVASLIDKNNNCADTINFINPEDLDKKYSPSDFLTPLAMDSSQLAVLAAADAGKTFVIKGPPGTGKSQTISNLIAHLIGKNKTVLFVSEKMAALDVVYKRLEQIGLGNFCLCLHSNKANKKDVLAQLKKSWDNASSQQIAQWDTLSVELLNLRNELNEFENILHKPFQNGITPYYALGTCIKNSKYLNLFRFNFEKQHSTQDYNLIKDLLNKIIVQATTCKNNLNSENFKLINNKIWDLSWQKNLIQELHNINNIIPNLRVCAEEYIKIFGINPNVNNIEILKNMFELAKLFNDTQLKNTNYAFSTNANDIITSLEDAVENLKLYIQAKDSLHCICPSDIWKKLDGNIFVKRWENANTKWFLPSIIEKFAIISELKKAGLSGNIVMPDDAFEISKLAIFGKKLLSIDNTLKNIQIWKKEETNITDIENSIEFAKNLRTLSAKLTDNTQSLSEINSKIDKTIKESSELFFCDSYISRTIQNFEKIYNEFDTTLKKIASLNCSISSIQSLEDLLKLSQEIITKENELKDWCLWQHLKSEAKKSEILPIIETLENNKIKISEIETAFNAGYCMFYAQKAISENSQLREFSGAQEINKIEKFIKLDEKFQNLTIDYIKSKLSEKIPKTDDQSVDAEWKLIKRETQKQRQIKPVRQILANAFNAVKTLTPCFMMSPLSVAQYLPISQNNFDVVVFDEASQITVWDAIGTLSRGKQVIVAGDPNQMPPTNFFGRNIEYNEDELGFDEDLGSILDELIGSSIPTLSLNWHYRSRCESLITFSNQKYYENSLVTFPSANTCQKSVSMRYIENACYEKGARTNKLEAKAIVEECIKRLTSKNEYIKNQSIGIVTFNSEQQRLIEDLLDKERENYPEIEFAFNPENMEHLFVKNLETVQGDERDVILFSVTYGPDKDGKVSMNFGPLNKNGGERRLNVAFTRSKQEMVIFSSLQPEQINLTGARGVEDLKSFLQYAKSKKNTTDTNITSKNIYNSPFEEEIVTQLRNKGWTIHTQIGTSSYKIDIAVVHPDNPKKYLAGIECDGYKQCYTVKDRDKLRPAVLKGLGWNIIKVWIIDWWIDKNRAIEKLDQELKELYKTKSIV